MADPDAAVVISPATNELPEHLVELARESTGAGISNVTALIKQWVDGTQ